ncbi:MAG: M48 family metalloprotease [Kiritimatiellae bacterium]|nr:M48 family metalloprotease [Kiritimatiellia bacterium]MBP5226260.1 M48 family metalloprotease [Kiritimatiellia bacterium]
MKRAILLFPVFGALCLTVQTGCETITAVANSATEITTAVASDAGYISKETAGSINRTSAAITKTFEDITPEQEYYIGRSVAATLLATYQPDDDPTLNGYVTLVGQTLALFSERPETFKGYHFQIFRSEEVNAFAAPGGMILISHGLLKCCRNEDELAAVIAHEIGHVEKKHGLKAIRTGRLSSALSTLVTEAGNTLTGHQLQEVTAAFNESVNDITGTLINNGYSRSLEYDADQAAIRILRNAGYNPHALVSMLTRMKQQLGAHSGGFGKTHPSPDDRMQRIQKSLSGVPADTAGQARRMERFKPYAGKF